MAWHVAALGRFEFDGGFPSIEKLTGAAPREQRQGAVQMLHNLALWEAATVDQVSVTSA